MANTWKHDFERVMEYPSIKPEYKQIIRAYVEEIDAKIFGAKDEQRFAEKIAADVNFLNREQGERIQELEQEVKTLRQDRDYWRKEAFKQQDKNIAVLVDALSKARAGNE